ncbi:hypothetical protein KGF54_000290 [Candida jiufengensis]|uniref:uncharacterized protein n=1 Tax=Candida jiufengensis TaxID=497108 RepID=UPI002224D873|nr:uncharacterized protein KGF54_000290 [Candida jiufengensis]KAI5957362.1 hypothetical protein KGF54_000290 [Candida jiufengensis]
MSANLQTKLDNSLNDILKTSGFIFEIINNNKKQSSLITGPNNQLIQPTIIQQLTNHINKFDEILDETIFKFGDAKWCIDTMIENKQKQEELKIKEELEKQKREAEAKRLKEEMEAKKKAEEAAAARAKIEAEAKAKAEAEAKKQAEKEAAEMKRLQEAEDQKRKEEEEQQKKQEEEERERQQREQQREQQQQQQQQQQSSQFGNFDDLLGFDVSIMPQSTDQKINDENDFLSSINYNDINLDIPMDDDNKDNDVFMNIDDSNNNTGVINDQQSNTNQSQLNNPQSSNNNNNGPDNKNDDDMDLDMNNLLGNDESILDGLNMSLLDTGFEGEDNNINNATMGEEFDVDNFLNQFSS